MRTIPIALQQHLDSGTTTTCLCVLIEPVAPGYAAVGVTTLDRDLSVGGVTYSASVGLDGSAHSFAADMSVDNSEGRALVPEFEVPVTEQELIAGVYDYARWTSYLVNFENVTQRVELARGELGQVRVINGMSFTFEMLGLTKRLKQSVVESDSLRCRAIFGSQGEGSGAEVTQRFPCGFDTSVLWRQGVTLSVGEESNVSFKTNLVQADGFFKPGLLQWLTGKNAGRRNEVEEFAGAVVSLAFPTMFPIQIGDSFQIRPDCSKWKDGANGCKAWWGGNWVLHYRGEPFIPVGDTGQVNSPGASV